MRAQILILPEDTYKFKKSEVISSRGVALADCKKVGKKYVVSCWRTEGAPGKTRKEAFYNWVEAVNKHGLSWEIGAVTRERLIKETV